MNFRKYLNKSKKQLDISIMSAEKYLTTSKKIEEFLSSETSVEHKSDGIKLTIIKQSDNGNLKDYIFAYKSNILYNTEYEYQPYIRVKEEAIGASQFKTVFKHFELLGKNSIPVGTELFIEFLMSKPTLSSNYSKKHKMVLIGYAPCSWEVKFGRLFTNPGDIQTDHRDQYAKELKIEVPQLLFTGILGSQSTFERGIKNKLLLKEFNIRKNSINWNNPKLLVADLRQMFLAIESKYGGLEEGVIIKYDDKILKWQQEYQLNQLARDTIKARYKEDDPIAEFKYWEKVKSSALEISNGIIVKSRKLEDILFELSLVLKKLSLDFSHSKKTKAMIKDDIQLNTKLLLIKKMRGNNNALFFGKFRVLQNMHYKIIKSALKLYDNVIVCLVTSKENMNTKDLRMGMLQSAFPELIIIQSIDANLIRILQKTPLNINVILTGSDRLTAYSEQSKRMLGVSVKETPRSDSDISASKIIDNINDEDFFMRNTPNEIHLFYKKIKEVYGNT